MMLIKSLADCTLCHDWLVSSCSIVVKYVDRWQVGDPQCGTMGRIDVGSSGKFRSTVTGKDYLVCKF